MWKSILTFAALVASAANAASSAASTCDSYEETNLLQLPTTLSPDEQEEKETAERIEKEHKRVLAAETASETGEATVEEDVTLSPDEQDEKETAERIEKEHKRVLGAETASETGEATVEEDATLSPDEQDEKETAERIEEEHKRVLAAETASETEEANLLQLPATLSPDEQDEKETAERIEEEHKRLLAAETASETGEATVEEDATEATVEEDGDATRTASMTSVGNRPKCAQDGKYGIIVVDMQNDFVEADGSLPVAGAEEIIPTINKLVNELEWDFTTFTEDFHPRDHISFAVNSPLKKEPFDFVTLSYDQSLKICGTEYESVYGPMAAGDCSEKITLASFEQQLWPKHCIQNTEGQQFHADLKIPQDAFILRKGVNSITDSYGAFYDNIGMHLDDDAPPETSFQIETGLFGALQLAGVQHVFLTGVAEDYCVKYTALQALKEGFGVYLVTDATKPVIEAQGEEALEDLKQKGAKLIKSCEVLGTCECSS